MKLASVSPENIRKAKVFAVFRKKRTELIGLNSLKFQQKSEGDP